MRRQLFLIGLIAFLVGCGSNPPTTVSPPSKNLQREFETAIADEIIREIIATLPTIKREARSIYLNEKLLQFNQGVDLKLVSERIRQEHQLLTYLVSRERDVQSSSIFLRANAQASLDWQDDEYRTNIQSELNRTANAITERQEGDSELILGDYFESVRASAEYPEDSFEGRQSYLDTLADTMYTTQVDWFDLLLTYGDSSLALFGEDSDDFMFRYNSGELTVNLKVVERLPISELDAVAAFYGFPGLEVIRGKSDNNSLTSLLKLPGVELGWASFILSRMAQQEDSSISYVHFEHFLTTMAWLDLNLNTGDMTIKEAEAFLAANSSYTDDRVSMHVRELQVTPGRYLSASAGKITLQSLHNRCLSAQGDCEASFNQTVIERGAVPFESLSQRLERQW